VRGIPKLVIANEEAVAAAACPSILVPLIYGICVSAFESVAIAPSDTC
jgi:flagellar biosynthesis protein FliQ